MFNGFPNRFVGFYPSGGAAKQPPGRSFKIWLLAIQSNHETNPVISSPEKAYLGTGALPKDWLRANVVPMFKKWERHNVRPPTIVLCKVMAHIHVMVSNIIYHFDTL